MRQLAETIAELDLRSGGSMPRVPAIDVYAALVDATPLTVTITVGTERVEHDTTVDDVQRNLSLWRRTHVADWNKVPESAAPCPRQHVRTTSIHPHESPPVGRDARARLGPCAATDAHGGVSADGCLLGWVYDVGGRQGLPSRLVADTRAAIVMSESWFDHRGLFVNGDGSRDIGLAGASDVLGTEYFEAVQRRLTRFIRNRNAPPAWDYVWRRGRELERQEWPWVSGRSDRGPL
jgi:hypothetical protein